ncbi:TolC family protein [Noviherbaspirillum soli]|uniref:TolC family protein n=1 Tax=Noviherbaspirillum soli TaxID=1064518 RepID=UPI00188D27FB|nr:TolC family protein [Noviherbaspirillum soli]
MFFTCGSASGQQFSGRLLDAVRLTLLHEPQIGAANRQLMLSEGQLQVARGEFDTALTTGVELAQARSPLLQALQSPAASQVESSTASYLLGATSRLRSGVTVAPSVRINRVRDNIQSLTSPATGTVALNFTVPLQKGRGTRFNTAAERAAEQVLASADMGLRHTIASRISRSVNAYWDYLAALQALDIRRLSENRSLLLLDDARRLARGDEIPQADVLQYEAQVARDRGLRIAAEQSLAEARAALVLAMGIAGQPDTPTPAPSDDFPELPAAVMESLSRPWPYSALAARFDVRAQQRRVDAAEILYEATRRDPISQLDLTLSVGYSGLRENRAALAAWQALNAPASGLNASIGLVYVLPVQGNTQAGLVRQRAALAEQARLELDGLLQAAHATVSVQRASVLSAALQLEQARQQVRLQTQVFADERKKYRLGLATVLDLLTAEARLTADELGVIDARRRLAQALASYRFETATLLGADGDEQRVTMESLTTLPELP